MAPSTTRKTTTTTRTIITTTTRTTMTTRSNDPSSSNSSSVPLEPQPARTKRPASALARERTRSGSDTSSTGSCDVIDLTVPPLHVFTERTEGSNEDVLPQEEARAERRIRTRSQTERDTRIRRSSNQRTGISPSAVVADIFQAIMETEIRTPRARSRSGTQPEGERRGRGGGGGGGRPTTTTTTTMPSADIPPLDFNLTGDYRRCVPSPKVLICSPPKTVPEHMRRLESKGFTRNGSAVIIFDEGASLAQTSVAATLDNPPNLSASSSSSSSTSSTSSTTVPPSRIPKTKTVAGRIKCPICSHLPSNGWHAIRCGHVFCENCIPKVKNQRSCAACGKSVKPSDVRRLFL